MKILHIEWSEVGDENVFLCPICNEPWINEADYDVKPCQHLQFMWGDQGDPIFYGVLDEGNFLKAYKRTYSKVESCSIAEADTCYPRESVFSKMKYPGLSFIVSFRREGDNRILPILITA